MSKRGDDKLRAVWQAGQLPDASRPIGELVERHGGRHAQAMLRQLSAIRNAIETVVDQPFRDHCQRMSYEAGVLTLGVDDPGMIYLFRRRYLFLLRQHLLQTLPSVPIREIRFKAVRMDEEGVLIEDDEPRSGVDRTELD